MANDMVNDMANDMVNDMANDNRPETSITPQGTDNDRRRFLKCAAGAGLAAASGMAGAQNVDVLSLPPASDAGEDYR